jgi:hypothetical protein
MSRHGKSRKAIQIIRDICKERKERFIKEAIEKAAREAKMEAERIYGKLRRDATAALPLVRRIHGKGHRKSIKGPQHRLADAAIGIAEFASKSLTK